MEGRVDTESKGRPMVVPARKSFFSTFSCFPDINFLSKGIWRREED
jgi:hypothetical protein